ncbi:hypothetical protein MRX96_031460 [Rhipicephalus microplus]
MAAGTEDATIAGSPILIGRARSGTRAAQGKRRSGRALPIPDKCAAKKGFFLHHGGAPAAGVGYSSINNPQTAGFETVPPGVDMHGEDTCARYQAGFCPSLRNH